MDVKLANDLGMTAVGFVRGKDMTVYTNEWSNSQLMEKRGTSEAP